MDKTSKIHWIKYTLYVAGATFCACKGILHLLDIERHETINRTADFFHDATNDLFIWIAEKYPESAASLDAFCKEHYDEIMGYLGEKYGK